MSLSDDKRRLPVAPPAESPSAPPRNEPVAPAVCRHLRTKTAFGGDGSWMRGESTTAVYWCLRTMETFGPDGSFCHPHECAAGRRCHTARDDI